MSVGLPRHGGSGGTRTHKGLATPTCFRDRPLIWPDRFPERKGRDSHPHGLATRTRVAGGLLIWPVPFHDGALGGSRTHYLVRTGDALWLAELQGPDLFHHASPARLERATPAFGGRCSRPLSYGEMSVDGRGRTRTFRFRRPVPSPFGHVDVAPPTGIEPVTFCSTGSCSSRLSYGGVVRALGLEPSLVRGKSPVPYLSGVTRVVGREGIEPPVSEDGWSTASCAPWRDRPMSKPGGAGLDGDVSAVVKVLMAGLVARREQARKVSNPRPSVLETAAPPLARAQGNARMTLCA